MQKLIFIAFFKKIICPQNQINYESLIKCLNFCFLQKIFIPYSIIYKHIQVREGWSGQGLVGYEYRNSLVQRKDSERITNWRTWTFHSGRQIDSRVLLLPEILHWLFACKICCEVISEEYSHQIIASGRSSYLPLFDSKF